MQVLYTVLSVFQLLCCVLYLYCSVPVHGYEARAGTAQVPLSVLPWIRLACSAVSPCTVPAARLCVCFDLLRIPIFPETLDPQSRSFIFVC